MDQPKGTEGRPAGGKGSSRAGRRLRRAALVVAGVLTAFLFLVSSTALGLLWYADSQIDRIDREELPDLAEEPSESREPVNVLILGSDTRAVLSEEEQERKGTPEQVGGERSDTIILAHFDPERDEVVLVHFPRDLRVEIPDHGLDKVNAAFTLGGPNLTVKTIRGFASLPIHHYVEVNFVGFRKMVEALGGVEVCVDRAMIDPLAELRLPRAGCYAFDGDRALAFVRARNVEGDLIPDFARIGRQQQFIRAVMNEVFALSSLWRLPNLVTVAARNVTTDDDVSVTDLIDLGRELRGLAEVDPSGASTVDLRVIPGVPQSIDGVSYVIAEQPATRRFFKSLRLGRPLGDTGTVQVLTPVSPALIRVRVLDAGRSRGAQRAEDRLRDAGFIVLDGGKAPGKRTRSEILFARGAEGRAEVVGGFYSSLPLDRAPKRLLDGADVVLIVGPDFKEVRG